MAATYDLRAFSRDWAEARAKFVDAARRAGAVHRAWLHPLKGPGGEALCTDTAWLGPRDASRVLVVIAGTHGVEGFCGSGPMVGLLRGDAALGLPPDTGALLIHGINPHGWAWLRRVTEENVDLNRNWVEFDAPLPANPGYAALHVHLVPASRSPEARAAGDAACAAYVAAHGAHALRVASSSGQYTHPDGWFHGGTGPTWARRTSEAILAEYLPRARTVAIVDMHTGLGPSGYGEPICNPAPGGERVRRARAWWGDSVTEPLLGTSSSQEKWGLSEFGYERCLAHADIAFVALEFGTYPEARGFAVLRDEHWLHAHGDPLGPDAPAIKAAMRDHFYPPHDDWKEMVLFRSWQVWRQGLAGLAAS
ncbi:MAG: M14 family metallopeptidase [Burkholderiales bacterium]